MVLTKKDFDEGIEDLRNEIKSSIEKGIHQLREQVINNLVEANKQLQGKVRLLENAVTKLQGELEASQNYSRLNNIVISGIPKEVDHKDLEKAAIGVMNACLESPINARDFEACHRISPKSNDVVCRVVNRKDVDEALDNRANLRNLDKAAAGLPLMTGNVYLNSHLTPYKAKIVYLLLVEMKYGLLCNPSSMGVTLRFLLRVGFY